MIEQLIHPQVVQALGWTLLHSLWQGAAFALVLAVLLISLRSYTAQARYLVSAGLLAAFFLTVGGTFWQQWQQADPNVRSASIVTALSDDIAAVKHNDGNEASPQSYGTGVAKTPALASNEKLSVNNKVVPTPLWKSATQTLSNYYTEHLPLLVTLWLMGILVLQLRFLGQLAFVQRLKHYGTKAFPDTWSERIDELEAKLRIQKKVVYRTTLRTSSPMVIGWLKPVVLFPQMMLAKLSDTEIYAVLAHELAHVRRDDFAVNLLQTFLSNVFFFHPGVWWMSNQVDEEREHCCDDLAIIATGEAIPYAKTLLSVSQLHRTATTAQPQLAMAMSGSEKRKKGSGFADRVKRLFSKNSGAGTYREGFATACILFAGLGMAFAFTSQTEIPLADRIETLVESQRKMTKEQEQQNTTPAQAISSPRSNTIVLTEVTSESGLPIEEIAPIAGINNGLSDGNRSTTITTTTRVFSTQDPKLASLLNAIRKGNIHAVQQLLDQGAPVNGTYVDIKIDGAWTPLLLAASENELEIVELLIGRGADVNAVTNSWTPLLEAADEGSLETLSFLLKSGADINWYQGPNSPTALSQAAGEGKKDCLIALIKAGANINGFGESLPPLHAAANEGKTEIMRALITRGAEVNKTDAIGRTALMYAASEGNGDAVALLVSSKADPNLADYAGLRAVEFALEEDAEDLAHFLALITDGPACATHLKTHTHTDVHVDVNVGENEDPYYVLSKEDEQRVEAAMKEAERIQLRNEQAMARAEEAVRREESRMERMERTIEVHSRRQGHISGELFDAINSVDIRKLQELLQSGINPNTRNDDGYTALIFAVLHDAPSAVSLLLTHGADPNSRTDSGWTPIHFAALQGNITILATLLELDVNIEARADYSSTDGSPENGLVAWDYQGATPLLIAIENNNVRSTNALLDAGANPDARMTKVEYTRAQEDANGFGLSQVTNSEQPLRPMKKDVKVFSDWTPRRQAKQLNNPNILVLLNK